MPRLSVHVPPTGGDHVPVWQLALFGTLGVGLGLMVARWAVPTSPMPAAPVPTAPQAAPLPTVSEPTVSEPAVSEPAVSELAVSGPAASEPTAPEPPTTPALPVDAAPNAPTRIQAQPEAIVAAAPAAALDPPEAAAKPAPPPPAPPAQAPTAQPPTAQPHATADTVLTPDAPEPQGSPLTFEPGRLAYLRCTGSTEMNGDDCPRDLDLERKTWAILARLPRCEALAGLSGPAEVWLTYASRRSWPLVKWKLRAPTQLPAEALEDCVGDHLRTLPTRIRSTSMVLSVRFRLR